MFKSKLIPILFSTQMVQVLLRNMNPKTVTRRSVGLDTVNAQPDLWETTGELYVNEKGKLVQDFVSIDGQPLCTCVCPYGKPGDVLWVREGFHQYGRWAVISEGKREWHPLHSEPVKFIADGPAPEKSVNGLEGSLGYRWRTMPSIHLKFINSRIWLEVKSVRIERLNAITGYEVLREGIGSPLPAARSMTQASIDYRAAEPQLISDFRNLWVKLNGSDSWEQNPWVWVVEFERTEKPAT